MTSQSIRGGRSIALLAAMCISLGFQAQEIKAYDPSTGEELNVQQLPNHVRFKVVNLDPPPSNPNSDKPPRWAFLWDFGDCSYPSTDKDPVHTYATEQDDYDVSVMLTPIYSDEDVELPEHTKAIQVNGPYNTDPNEQLEDPLPEGQSITLRNVRDCKPGDLITFIIPYENTGSGEITAGRVMVEYPYDVMEFDTGYVGQCGHSGSVGHTTNQSQTRGRISLNVKNVHAGEQHVVTLSLLTKSNAAVGSEVRMYVRLDSDTNGTEVDSDTLNLDVVSSYDPNRKLVFDERMCAGDTMRYVIEFENEGSSPAAWVYIIDDVDAHLDMSTFELELSSHETQSWPVVDSVSLDGSFNPYFLNFAQNQKLMTLRDTTQRKMGFVFRDINLEPSEAQEVSIPATLDSNGVDFGTGYLRYTITQDSNNPASGPFGTHANIHFDDNYPIVTNAAMARNTLCYCIPSFNFSGYEWVGAITVDGATNASGNNGGYADFRHVAFDLRAGGYHSIQLAPGFVNAPTMMYWEVRIDFDQNGAFDTSEVVFQGSGMGTVQSNVFIPLSAMAGETAMRITMSKAPFTFACGASVDGETEDYTVIIRKPWLADLDIVDRFINRNSVVLDSSFNTQLTIKNIGLASTSGPVVLEYYLSSNPVLDQGDTWLKQSFIPTLGSDSTFVDSATLNMPTGLTGSYYIVAVIDPYHSLMENLEGNNSETFQVRIDTLAPDLEAKALNACQAVVRTKGTIDFSLEVSNNGTAPACDSTGFVQVALFLSNDPWLDMFDQALDTVSLDTVHAGEQVTVSGSHTLSSSIGFGNYFLLGQAVPAKFISERNTANNVARTRVKVIDTEAATPAYFTGFECGQVDGYWETDSTQGSKVGVELSPGSFEGSYHLRVRSDSVDSVCYSDLHVNAILFPQLSLFFRWKDFSVSDSTTDDAVLLSDNGQYFIPVRFLHGTDTLWNDAVLNIQQICQQVGIMPSNDLIIRFQHRGTNTGFGFDSVAVVPVSPPMQNKGNGASAELLDFLVFPNPTTGLTHVEYRVRQDLEQVSISLFNVAGQQVRNIVQGEVHRAGSYQRPFAADGLPAGLYLCVMTSESGQRAQRLVVEP